MKKNAIKQKLTPLSIILLVLLICYVVFLIFPFLWALISSLKADIDFRNNLFGLPRKWMFSNYSDAVTGFFVPVESGNTFRNVYMFEQFFNSVLYSAGCAFTATFVPCFVGYLTAKFRYKFSSILTAVVIICITLPVVGSLPSEIKMAKAFYFYDHVWGMWMMKANFLSMYLLVFQGVFRGVPNEFIEAAKMDGAGNMRIFRRIMFPLVSQTFLTVFLLNFIAFWNDYQTPLIFMPNVPTVSYGLYLFNRKTEGQFSTIPMKLTGSVLVFVPVLILFCIFQKRLVGNITVGGLK